MLDTMDQGIGANICGMLLTKIASNLEGRSFKTKVSNLWTEVKQLYAELKVDYKLANLTPEILNKGKKSRGPGIWHKLMKQWKPMNLRPCKRLA